MERAVAGRGLFFEQRAEAIGLGALLVLCLGIIAVGARWFTGAVAGLVVAILIATILLYAAAALIGGTVARRKLAPYGLLKPGLLWLCLFFLAPLWSLVRMSLSERKSRFDVRPAFGWKFSNFGTALSDFGAQFGRGFLYAGIATVLTILIGFPNAYVIAFRGGRYRSLLLGLIVIPFFTSYLIRTLAWQTILADEGPFMNTLRTFHLVGFFETIGVVDNGRLINTASAVISELTYNFLPFMILPIYVKLGEDRHPPGRRSPGPVFLGVEAFFKIVLPLAIPGLFAGTLLTFIPAAGDFVNAKILGGPTTTMIGNSIQDQFLTQNNYPVAAAMSLVLMTIITVSVFVYSIPRHGGPGMSAATTTRTKIWRGALNVFTAAGFAYLFAPIVVIVAFSFNKPAGKFNIIWREFTSRTGRTRSRTPPSPKRCG
ncbi:MAG: ABC transporter permease [Ilumatobacteraceae bacterium]